MTKTEISTPRLFLREFKSHDLDAVHVFASDPEVTKHSSWGPRFIDETQSWLDEILEAQTTNPRVIYEWAITKIGSADVIGTCRLGIKSIENREGYIGYTFTKDEWGKGYATELSKALLQYGFTTLQLHRVYATSSPDNISSHRVLEKCGMIREGVLRKNILQNGKMAQVLYKDKNGNDAVKTGNLYRDKNGTLTLSPFGNGTDVKFAPGENTFSTARPLESVFNPKAIADHGGTFPGLNDVPNENSVNIVFKPGTKARVVKIENSGSRTVEMPLTSIGTNFTVVRREGDEIILKSKLNYEIKVNATDASSYILQSVQTIVRESGLTYLPTIWK